MIRLMIDNQTVEVPESSTILQAAEQLGIRIPTMCYRPEFEASTSCMVCVVQVEGAASLVPSCAMKVWEGMAVHTNTPEVLEARRSALELLISDHVGDCEGPCRMACPAGMDIPQMLRWIAVGEMKKAIRVIKRDIPIPAVLGRICPAPCEKVCRRNYPNEPNSKNEAISICLLKRYAADVDLASFKSFEPICLERTGKKVAVVGAGPCGLSVAYYLAQKGHSCAIFDKADLPGGLLRSDHIDRKMLPLEVLDREIQQILKLNIEFRPNMELGGNFSFDDLHNEFDAILLGTGDPKSHGLLDLVQYEKDHISVERGTFRTSLEGIFAAGGAIAQRKMAVQSVQDGKLAARIINLYLTGKDLKEEKKEFNCRLSDLDDEGWRQFSAAGRPGDRVEPESNREGFNEEQARREAARCLHCDCRKKKNCKLRKLSTEHSPSQTAYKGRRRPYVRQCADSGVLFESGKCISCGLCIQFLADQAEAITFAGRGFNMQLTGALDRFIVDITLQQARECIRVCPTGAWALAEIEK